MLHRSACVAVFCVVTTVCCAEDVQEQPVGQRPYEMVWANRTEDAHPALVDFESLAGWTVECVKSQAALVRCRQQQLWGKYVGRLVYRGENGAAVTIRPPKPIPIARPFDCINFWVFGNNWAWVHDPATPQVDISILLRNMRGEPVRISLGHVNWQEWWLMHRRIPAEQLAPLQDGAVLEGIQISGGHNKDDRVLYFDNLSLYQEQLAPLKFEPRPQRNLTLPPGQTTGTNTGPGRLPFPNREETILPTNLTDQYKVRLEERGGGYEFRYEGRDGQLVYRYKPETGTLGDITAEWIGRGKPFRPMVDGGPGLVISEGQGPAVPEKIERVRCGRDGDMVQSVWRYSKGGVTAEAAYTIRLWQKSLVIDLHAPGGQVGEFSIGRAVGLDNPRLVTLPYLVGDQARPAVVVSGAAESPLFTFAILDHYRSNASKFWMANQVSEKGVTYNGGSRYQPRTDGRRNDCFERLFLSVSPRFEEVLPNIPNPKSPWMHVAGERLWIAHGASDRQRDYELFKSIARYGMTKVVITDHETGWRDGGESFTFRTRAAPGRGGDQSQAEYARKLHALGFRYGIYNNYTDYAPINEHWNEDRVTRNPDGDWRRAWARCYNPKPARAVEFEARLAPIIQEKFHLDTAYCDVHTAVRPWDYVDCDARVPGAGTFAATLFAYGEIMLHQKKTWNGPVYSEGNNHWYYCGLTDGNYGQDQAAHLPESPWLVDFDLRKIHPLCCNFGMGNPGMFYGERHNPGDTPEERRRSLDRFLAATLAFGHTGFLVLDGGMPSAVSSYFNLQQVHAHYAQETAVDIRYGDGQGHLLDTSSAVATGAYRRSQVVTRYSNGLTVTVNGHPTETWTINKTVLPPNGWQVEGPAELKLTAASALVDGHRADYVDSPAYLYTDGRGSFTRFAKSASNGPLIALYRQDGTLEVIPVAGCTQFAVGLNGRDAKAIALDIEGKQLGPAETRLSRGLVHIVPVPKAFSYLLTPGPDSGIPLNCTREKVIAGETVSVEGKKKLQYQVPADAAAGSRIWHQVDGAWIDFTVVPLVDSRLQIADRFQLDLMPHVELQQEATIQLADQPQTVTLAPGKPVHVEFPGVKFANEEVRPLLLHIKAGPLSYQRTWWLKGEEGYVSLGNLSPQITPVQCLRGKPESPTDPDTGAHVVWTECRCGGVSKQGLDMHPPYKSGTGYTANLCSPVELPAEPAAALRCLIGKGDGSDPGDGILFRVAVVEPGGQETVVAERHWKQHAWTALEADLSRWAGRRIQLKLIADAGAADDSTGDWAFWADLRLQSLRRSMAVSLHEEPVELARQPGPKPQKDLTLEKLRHARSAMLHFQAIGLQNDEGYRSSAKLNEVPLGPIPASGGDEVRGVWGDVVIPVPTAAIASLDEWNQLAIQNPNRDCFKVRRFWIELELADGQICSSQVSMASSTQPPDWRYHEGIGVPYGEEVRYEIRFPLP